ncbi:hypothetical protein DFJ58DRAFT_22226 [Suillus subalutaceus]|uniref:uncharacterized protein n=1 Tax=Suillus subalutaceus TaxID=48586 RepID=UPI001B883884|nr:uncharacterized protein DFJ58DRAFT_22226 [Suillus subalutaceus]KAG1870710.1 hypothetical protein DFJ58DRAFT_22226 [Suillus subalutaceus]
MISSPNRPGQPNLYVPRTWDGSSSNSGYSCCDYAQQHHSNQSAPVPKPQDISIPPPQTIYSASSTFGCFRSPAMRSDYSSSYTFPMWYPDVHRSHSTTVIKQDLPFVFGPEMSTSDVLLYNEPLYQWQNSAVSQPGPLISTQPHASHSGNIYHLSDQRASSQPNSILLHSHPPPPLLCRWLRDDTVCGFTGTLEALKAHCKTSHFAGPPSALVECRWEACEYHKRDDPTIHVMRRDCMWRHTREVHLGMKRGV